MHVCDWKCNLVIGRVLWAMAVWIGSLIYFDGDIETPKEERKKYENELYRIKNREISLKE